MHFANFAQHRFFNRLHLLFPLSKFPLHKIRHGKNSENPRTSTSHFKLFLKLVYFSFYYFFFFFFNSTENAFFVVFRNCLPQSLCYEADQVDSVLINQTYMHTNDLGYSISPVIFFCTDPMINNKVHIVLKSSYHTYSVTFFL